jgi:hypothetical protein
MMLRVAVRSDAAGDVTGEAVCKRESAERLANQATLLM